MSTFSDIKGDVNVKITTETGYRAVTAAIHGDLLEQLCQACDDLLGALDLQGVTDNGATTTNTMRILDATDPGDPFLPQLQLFRNKVLVFSDGLSQAGIGVELDNTGYLFASDYNTGLQAQIKSTVLNDDRIVLLPDEGNGTGLASTVVIHTTKDAITVTTGTTKAVYDKENATLYNSSNQIVAQLNNNSGLGELLLKLAASNVRSKIVPTSTSNETFSLPNKAGAGGTFAMTSDLPAVTTSEYTSATSSSSLTPTCSTSSRDSVVMYVMTAQAVNFTVNAPTGTWQDEKILEIRVKATGSITLTWNAIFRASSGYALPTGLGANQVLRAQFNYNSTDTKYDLTGLSIN